MFQFWPPCPSSYRSGSAAAAWSRLPPVSCQRDALSPSEIQFRSTKKRAAALLHGPRACSTLKCRQPLCRPAPKVLPVQTDARRCAQTVASHTALLFSKTPLPCETSQLVPETICAVGSFQPSHSSFQSITNA